MSLVRVVETHVRVFVLSYLLIVFGVALVVADLVYQWTWYSTAISNETIAIAPLSVNHQLDNRSIPMLPYPATEQAFLWSIVITVLYHVLINLFTLAYWIMSTDTVYIKFGGEEPVPDANGERPQLFGRLFGLFDLDRMWHPRIRHASILFWLVAPIILRRRAQSQIHDPLFRIESGIDDDDINNNGGIDNNNNNNMTRNMTDTSPLFQLNKAQMSMSYTHFPVFSWTLFRFFWFFYVPPVTLLGHIRLSALLIAYNRQVHTFGKAHVHVVSGLVWTVMMVWALAAFVLVFWFASELMQRRVVGWWQRRTWLQRRQLVHETAGESVRNRYARRSMSTRGQHV